MNALIVVPKDKVAEGQAQMAAWAQIWEQSGLEITHRTHNWIRASNDDRVTVYTYPQERSGDVKGSAVDVLMVHLDIVCERDWRQLEEVMLACVTGPKGYTRVFRCGDFKVYSVEES
jgi:hypothetical protein